MSAKSRQVADIFRHVSTIRNVIATYQVHLVQTEDLRPPS